jgi:hypothetical protein
LSDQEEAQVDFFKIAREIMRDHKIGTEGLLDEAEIEHKMVSMFMDNLAIEVGKEHGHAVERRPAPIIYRVVVQEQLEMLF